ncbi:MAG: CsgG/HfaB family protein [Myxococcaceae bacterium]
MIALALAALLCAAPAPSRKVVVVLYFDNNSPLREYDVLQKGLADMMVSDLSAVESLQLVEREKLQKLLDELALQKSRYFDPATAQKLGGGVGAQYAVTGALAAFDPQLRIDIRLIEIATGKVLVTDHVTGSKEKFFDLQQELVKKFVTGLQATMPTESRSGPADLAVVLKYSKGLDSGDKGDLKGASKQLAEVVRDAPDFALGKEQYAAVLKRLREAGKQRDDALGAEEGALVEGIDKALKRGLTPPLKPYELEGYFCYRGINASYLLTKIRKRLGEPQGPVGYQLAGKADRDAVLALQKRYFENGKALLDDSMAAGEKTKHMNLSVECPMSLYRLGSKDYYRLKPLEIPFYFAVDIHPTELAAQLARFSVLGAAEVEQQGFDAPEKFRFMPSLVRSDPSYGKKALELLDLAEKKIPISDSRNKEDLATLVAATRAEVLLYLGRPEEAIAHTQGFLERYPKARRYKDFEGLVEDLIGTSTKTQRAQKLVKSCAPELSTLIADEVSRVGDAEGIKGLRRLAGALERSCQAPAAQELLSQAKKAIAGEAVLRGDCALFREVNGPALTDYGSGCE